MKKILVFFLIGCLALVSVAGAEDIFEKKLGDLTLEELTILNMNIQLRLIKKSLVNGVRVDPGTYTVGKDLPEGEYRAEVILPENAYAYGLACVYNPDDLWTEASGGMTGKGYEKFGKIIMNDGQIFTVTLYSIVLYPYTGIIY